MNNLSLTMIEGKTALDIWLGGAVQDYNLLRVFECLTYFGVKDNKLNPREKSLCFLGVNFFERLQAMGL